MTRLALTAVTINDTDTGSLPVQFGAQPSATTALQSAAAADGNGTVANTDGMNGCQMLEIQKTGAGTTSAVIEGSYDGTTWYAVGYQQVDAISTLARAAAAIAIAAGTVNHVYQILDLYPNLRCRLASTAGVVAVTARLYDVPV